MKKLLALVLALVMTLSLCVTSNAAFTDAADVDYDEAVEVLTAVGVFKGYEDGSFQPTKTLTRAEAAKLIAYLDLGEKTAEALVGSGTAFSDVPASHWACGYIEYCASQGYLAGVGEGKFNPSGDLTVLAYAKMLLCVLGYDATIEGYVGADWSIKVSKQANKIDLLKNVDKSANAVVTREEAAQFSLNALKATCVEYTGGTNITIGGTTITQGATRQVVTAANGTAANDAISDARTVGGDDIIQLGEKLYEGKLEYKTNAGSGVDDLKRPAHTWVYKTKDVGKYADTADKTFVVTKIDGTSNQIDTYLKGDKYLNMELDADHTGTTNYAVNKDVSTDDGTYALELGDTIEVFTNDSGYITKAVVTRETVAQITKVTDNTGKATTTINGEQVVYNKNIYIDTTMNGTANIVTNDLDLAGYTADYVKDAYLTVVLDNAGTTILDSKVAATDKGAVTAFTDNTNITVNGTKYTYVNAGVTDPGTFNWKDGVYEVVKNSNGYALYVATVSGAITVDNIVYTNGTEWVEYDTKYGTTKATVYVQAVAMDGTVSNIAIGGFTGDDTLAADADSAWGMITQAGTSPYAPDINKVSEGLVSVTNVAATSTVPAHKTLASVGTGNTLKATSSDTIGSDTVLKTTDKKFGSYYTNAETQYILVTGTGATTKAQVYTGGIGYSVDASADKDFVLYTVSGSNSIAKVVVIIGSGSALTGSEVLYMSGATSVANGTSTYAATLYGMDGTSASYTVDNTYGDGFWKYTKDTDDVYTLTNVTADTLSGVANYVASNFVNGKFYENVGFKASYYDDALTIFDKADPAANVLADIDASKAVVVDVRSDSAKAANYNYTISDIEGLAAAASTFYTGTTNNNVVTISLYVTNNGAQVIFVNSLEEDAYTIAAQTNAANATFFLTRAANGTLSNPVTLDTDEINGGTTVYVTGSATAEQLTAAGVTLNPIVTAVDGTAGVYSFVMPYGDVAATVFTEADV